MTNLEKMKDNLSTKVSDEAQSHAFLVGAVSGSLLLEAIYLLRKSQTDNCKEWIENVGDCNKLECDFCRIEKCISRLEVGDAVTRFNSDKFIENVCLSFRHDYGLMAEQDRQRLRFDCKEWMRAITNNWEYFKS